MDTITKVLKNALNDVLLKGITAGVAGCNKRPLVLDVDTRECYEDYFDCFFQDKGVWNSFVSNVDERLLGREEQVNNLGERVAIVVRVLRSELSMRLNETRKTAHNVTTFKINSYPCHVVESKRRQHRGERLNFDPPENLELL